MLAVQEKQEIPREWKQVALENYSGKEEICLDGNLIYTTMYMGRLIGQGEGGLMLCDIFKYVKVAR